MASREIDTGNFQTAGRPLAADSTAGTSGSRRLRLDAKSTGAVDFTAVDRPRG